MDSIRVVHGRQFCFVGQLVYERSCQTANGKGDGLDGVGFRLYQGTGEDAHKQYLCLEDPDRGEELWYRVDGASLAPIGLQLTDVPLITAPRP